MNARAYRHHTGISRLHVINACATLVAIAGMAYGIVWPTLATISATLAHILPTIGAH